MEAEGEGGGGEKCHLSNLRENLLFSKPAAGLRGRPHISLALKASHSLPLLLLLSPFVVCRLSLSRSAKPPSPVVSFHFSPPQLWEATTRFLRPTVDDRTGELFYLFHKNEILVCLASNFERE